MCFEPLEYYMYEEDLPLPAGVTFKSELADHDFCKRLHKAFHIGQSEFTEVIGADRSVYWDKNIIGNRRNDIMRLMDRKEYHRGLRYMLSNPISHNLWYGFDSTAKRLMPDSVNVNQYGIYDVLRRFYEACGGRVHQFERRTPPEYIPVDVLIKEIERELNTHLIFPAPYAKMAGLINERGLIRNRALWGLYLAWRARQAGGIDILELGGGLGYAAYYSILLGANTHTIVDLPLTLVATGHFLGLSNGTEQVKLYGETELENNKYAFYLLPPQAFPENKIFDIVINMDSFPEFGLEMAQDYIKKIKKVTKQFLSINHEGESYTVRELLMTDPDVVNYSRHPFWLRKGYVEEMYEFK